jgi:8-oxo-dGTP pyrophosphatase MutT (NUDIX family)
MEKQAITTEPHFWNNMEFQIEFIPIENKENMPDLPWGGVYVIGNLNGKVPVVKYPENIEYPFGLPGGHREKDETIEQTLVREIKEELNMQISEWTPIGYERVSLKGKPGDYKYALYVYSILKKDGEFTEDVGGLVIGYDLVYINEVAQKVKKGERMNYIVKNLKPNF